MSLVDYVKVAIQADQASESFGKDLVQETLKAFNTKTIDIIVNNAVRIYLIKLRILGYYLRETNAIIF
jgi:hypothetical protein